MKTSVLLTVLFTYLFLAKIVALEIYFKTEEHQWTKNDPLEKLEDFTVGPSIFQELSIAAFRESQDYFTGKFEYELLKHRFKCSDKLIYSNACFTKIVKLFGCIQEQDFCASNRPISANADARPFSISLDWIASHMEDNLTIASVMHVYCEVELENPCAKVDVLPERFYQEEQKKFHDNSAMLLDGTSEGNVRKLPGKERASGDTVLAKYLRQLHGPGAEKLIRSSEPNNSSFLAENGASEMLVTPPHNMYYCCEEETEYENLGKQWESDSTSKNEHGKDSQAENPNSLRMKEVSALTRRRQTEDEEELHLAKAEDRAIFVATLDLLTDHFIPCSPASDSAMSSKQKQVCRIDVRKLTAIVECRWQQNRLQDYAQSQQRRPICRNLSGISNCVLSLGIAGPPSMIVWLLRRTLRTNRPFCTRSQSFMLLLSIPNEDSDLPVWLLAQLWESIPDPHYVKTTVLLTLDDEDLQLLIRPLSIDIGAWAGLRSCITTFPNPQS